MNVWFRATLLVHLRLLLMGSLSVNWAIVTLRARRACVRQAVAVLFLRPGLAVMTILRIALLVSCRSSLWTCRLLGLTLLTGSTVLFRMRQWFWHLWACLTVMMLCGLLIIYSMAGLCWGLW